jgi:protein TonB
MDQEQKKKRMAIGISIGVHGSLLLLFILILAWKEPNPPIPEYGIELNFGLSDEGSGDIQPETTTVNEQTQEDSQDTETETVESENTESDNAEDTVEDPIQESSESTDQQDVSDAESPDVVEEVEESTDVENNPDQTNSSESTSSSTNNEQTEDNAQDSQGDTESEEGDQGSEQGEINQDALYPGETGSANGASLEMAGWNWDFLPKPNDPTQESGKIVFQITIDDEGYITRIITLEKTVTPSVEKIYRDAVQELTFSKKSDYKPAAFSTGKITFIIKAN